MLQQVDSLIAAEKCKQAVELAKDNHKNRPSVESQQLLVRAYLARIHQFHAKGMMEEAQTLLTLVRERFPDERHQLHSIELYAAAAAGRFDELLKPLASDDTPTQTRGTIEKVLATRVVDLPAVASCNAVPAGHPIRVGAAAVWKAFVAVTTGPVTDDQIALQEISRKSPWSAWKMLIRAICAFHRNDDTGCRRALDAVPTDSAVAHAAATLRLVVDEKKPTAGIGTLLFSKSHNDDSRLREALGEVESELENDDEELLGKAVKNAIRLCTQLRPELLESMKLRTAIACSAGGIPPEEVFALFGPIPRSAAFWRSLAHHAEGRAPMALVAMYWERFVTHAVREGLFSDSSPEAAAVWLKIAEVLSGLSPRALQHQKGIAGHVNMISPHYTGQSEQICALKPVSDKHLAAQFFEPGYGFKKAAAIRPDARTFAKWCIWADRLQLPVKDREDIALAWQKGLPKDVQPLVYLSTFAEQRKAYALALRRLNEAEAIDPMNQSVRQARVRLTLSITWRHFADRKAHLVEKDIADLALLPSMGEGDRAAVLDSIRAAWHVMRNEPVEQQTYANRVIERLGDLCGRMILDSVGVTTKTIDEKTITFPSSKKAEPLDVARALARAIQLADDLKFEVVRPKNWDPAILKVLRQRPCALSGAEILRIGNLQLTQKDKPLAYDASAAGLSRDTSPAMTARFLLLRAKTFQDFEFARIVQCLACALELARQTHDDDLIRDVFADVDQDIRVRRLLTSLGTRLKPEFLIKALDKERKAEKSTRGNWGTDSTVIPELAESFSPFGIDFGSQSTAGYGSGFDPGFDEDEQDDEFYDDDDDGEDNDDDESEREAPGFFGDPELDMSLSRADVQRLEQQIDGDGTV